MSTPQLQVGIAPVDADLARILSPTFADGEGRAFRLANTSAKTGKVKRFGSA